MSIQINGKPIVKNKNLKKKKRIGFFSRQFRRKTTYQQTIFDAFFGIVLPVICCVFDPIVFQIRVWGIGQSMLGDYKPFAYVLSYVSIMALLAFLLLRKKLRWFNGILSGLFFLGSAISLMVGIIILPFSLLGLMILIGALGFTPLFSAFVYYRNAVRAYKIAKGSMDIKRLRHSLVLSAILSFSLPFFLNVKVKQEIDLMVSGDAQTIEAAGERLGYFAPLVNVERLAKRYDKAGNTADLNRAIEKTYLSLTGEDVKEMKRRLTD